MVNLLGYTCLYFRPSERFFFVCLFVGNCVCHLPMRLIFVNRKNRGWSRYSLTIYSGFIRTRQTVPETTTKISYILTNSCLNTNSLH